MWRQCGQTEPCDCTRIALPLLSLLSTIVLGISATVLGLPQSCQHHPSFSRMLTRTKRSSFNVSQMLSKSRGKQTAFLSHESLSLSSSTQKLCFRFDKIAVNDSKLQLSRLLWCLRGACGCRVQTAHRSTIHDHYIDRLRFISEIVSQETQLAARTSSVWPFFLRMSSNHTA